MNFDELKTLIETDPLSATDNLPKIVSAADILLKTKNDYEAIELAGQSFIKITGLVREFLHRAISKLLSQEFKNGSPEFKKKMLEFIKEDINSAHEYMLQINNAIDNIVDKKLKE